MANILSTQKKKQLKKDYILRIFTVILFSIGVSLFVGAVLLSPAFIMAKAYYSALNDNYLATQKHQDNSGYKDLKQTLTITNKMIDVIEKLPYQNVSELIQKISTIESSFNKKVRIKSINFDSTGGNQTLRFTGEVSSRDMLTQFVQKLKAEDVFKTVKVPLSNFAKSEHMIFSIVISL